MKFTTALQKLKTNKKLRASSNKAGALDQDIDSMIFWFCHASGDREQFFREFLNANDWKIVNPKKEKKK